MSDAASSPAKRARTDTGDAAASASSGADAKPILYSYWRSSSSWRVRIALESKGIKYEYRAIHMLKDGGEQLKDDYAALNPMRQVPTLIVDGHTLTQSMAIIEYLEETRPSEGASLLPGNAVQRAEVRAIAQMISCDIQPIQNLRVLKKVMSEVEGADAKNAKKLAWGKWAIETGFGGVEAAITKTAGKFAFGDTITLIDVALVPQVYNAGRFGVDMTAYPTIARVAAAAAEEAAFKAADPAVMPDSA